MSWDYIVNKLSFTGVKDVTVWQDVLFGVLLIPPSLEVLRRFLTWWSSKRPLQLLLKGYTAKNRQVFVFLSQLSAADENGEKIQEQRYVIEYPDPTTTNKNRLGKALRWRIDPLWSEADGECLADVYNILGRVGKVDGVQIGNLINDWSRWSVPIFSIGFNPKTEKLINKCKPIYFKLKAKKERLEINNQRVEINVSKLKIEGHDIELDDISPNDAAIVQKSFIKNTNSPVFLLAGIGTTGTSAAGYFLRREAENIGKLFGNGPFCFLLRGTVEDGKAAFSVADVHPKPSLLKIIRHPTIYIKFFRRKENEET